jgi:hypothetical protein
MPKGKLSKENIEPDRIQQGQYWRRISSPEKDYTYHEVPKGELVVIAWVDSQIHYACGEWDQSLSETQFREHFRFEPNGAKERDAEIQALVEESRTYIEAANKIADSPNPLGLIGTLPSIKDTKLLSSGVENVQQDESENDCTALQTHEPLGQSAARIKSDVTKRRNALLKFTKAVEARTSRIRALRIEQGKALEAALRIRKIAAVAEEVILTLNIYLGRGEEVVQISKGESAPAEQRIAVRQKTLYADEETALDADKGGLDFKNLEKFDQWLLVPKNLSQVLPESKGIIAFKPRRDKKHYSDNLFVNTAYNQLNASTYFLIRNGENLYRITTDIDIYDTLFPTRTEFDEFYFKNEYNFKTHKQERKPIRPGSEEFSKAMENYDEHQRYYGRILLFMQGLLDRSEIFAPLAGEEINLLQRSTHENYIQYIYDSEMLLPTGRPSFDDWLEGINSRLEIGHRIIGLFHNYGQRSIQEKGTRRVRPQGTRYPEDGILHTIEAVEHGAFVFRYKRNEKVYANWWNESHEAKNRASCLVYPTDNFIINIDEATIEDMEFYLQSRVDRHHYIDMFPLLEEAIKVKKQEVEDEIPFRSLLISEIVKACGCDFEEASGEVDELIHWWKFKNRVHRALTKDDAKALRMIVHEFELRSHKEDFFSKSRNLLEVSSACILNKLTQQGLNVVYIGYKNGNDIVVLVAENAEDIFVNEQTWKINDLSQELIKEVRWNTVDKRRLRWKELFVSTRWNNWKFDVRKEDYLTDPEKEDLLQRMLERSEDDANQNRRNYYGKEKGEPVYLPFCVEVEEQSFNLWYCDRKAFIPTNPLDEGHIVEAKITAHEFHWAKTKQGRVGLTCSTRGYYSYSETFPWESDKGRTQMSEYFFVVYGRTPGGLIWVNEENIKTFKKWNREYITAKAKLDKFSDLVYKLVNRLGKLIREKQIAEAFDSYILERDGDVDLWEDELKKLKLTPPGCDTYRDAVKRVVYSTTKIKEMTIGELIDKASALGFEMSSEDLSVISKLLTLPALDNKKD